LVRLAGDRTFLSAGQFNLLSVVTFLLINYPCLNLLFRSARSIIILNFTNKDMEREDGQLQKLQLLTATILMTFFFQSHRPCPFCSYMYLNPLKPSGKYMSHQLQQSLTLHFVFVGFV
jgi:hypothetical protein